MENKPTKQVLVIRRDLKLAKDVESKVLAQASVMVISDLLKSNPSWDKKEDQYNLGFEHNSKALFDFMSYRFRKIVVYVNSKEELLEVYNKAKIKNMLCSIVKINNEEASVCVGPDYDENFVEVSGNLPLY